jgi:hypothetical protein
MEWLSFSLLLIQVALIVATLWVWFRSKPEVLDVGLSEGADRRSDLAFLIAFAAFWLARGLRGRLWNLGIAIVFCAAAVRLLRDLGRQRKLARRIMEEKDGKGS